MLSNLPGIVLPLATVDYVYREKEQKHANGRQQLVDGAIEIWPIARDAAQTSADATSAASVH